MLRNTSQSFALVLLLVTLLVGSCKKPESAAYERQYETTTKNDTKETTLGKKMANPFTIDVMRIAINNLLAKKNRTMVGAKIEAITNPTHKYIRFKPANDDDVIALDALGYELSDVPLDQEIEDLGDWYHDPSVPVNEITYLYTVLPIGEPLPPGILATQLAELYLFDESSYDGDTQDEDPWIPDPGPACYEYNDKGMPYQVVCPTSRVAIRQNNIVNATKEIVALGLRPIDVYNEAMHLTGNDEEMVPLESATGRSMATARYSPAGFLRVQNNSAGAIENLKGVTVKARRWFKLRRTYTDANGHFSMPDANYRKKAVVLAKFKSGAAQVRGINGLFKVWQYVFPAKKNLGLFTRSEMENIDYTFNYSSDASSNQAMHWVAAQAMNAVWDMYQHCQANNIPVPPPNLNIWVSSAVTSDAATPMLRYIANTSLVSQGLDMFLASSPSNWSVLAIKHVIQANLPDITLRYGKNNGTAPLSSAEISNNVFHELGHSIHYAQVGNSYWTNEIAYTIAHGGYGDKTDNGAERAAVVEAWGFYIGNTFNATQYTPLNFNIAQSQRNQLESQTPVDNVSVQLFTNSSLGWIPFGMLHDMTDNGVEPIPTVVDNVNAFTTAQVFSGLQPGVTTVQGYKVEVLSRNYNLQANELNQLVNSYHY